MHLCLSWNSLCFNESRPYRRVHNSQPLLRTLTTRNPFQKPHLFYQILFNITQNSTRVSSKQVFLLQVFLPKARTHFFSQPCVPHSLPTPPPTLLELIALMIFGRQLKFSICIFSCDFNFISPRFNALFSKALNLCSSFNLLKPTGHVMHQQFNNQKLYALPTLYLCVLYLSENKQRLVPLTA